MWVLQGTGANEGKVHYLVCGQTLIVGRKDGHILLLKDVSISRKHAALNLTFPPTNLKTGEAAKVELSDLDSKYGTFINKNIETGKRLSQGATQELHHGDLVRFGLFDNTFRLEHQNLAVCTSTLKAEGRQQLINALVILGGHVLNDWSAKCNYLVMPAITLTVKVACALAASCSIVLPQFFTKLADAIIQKKPHPDPAEFLPPIEEMKISSAGASFSPDPRRSSIFAGFTFLFTTQNQRFKMCSPIQLAGGKAELLGEDNFEKVVSGKFILISHPTESQQMNSLYSRTCDLMKQHGLRTVQQSEIGLAILFVSTKGHCNSFFKDADIFKRSSSTSQPSEKLKIFATETQETELSVSLTGPKVVPDSGRQPTTSAQSEMAPPRMPLKRPPITNGTDKGKANCSNRSPSPDLTEPLSTMDLCDEDKEEDELNMEVPESTFQPKNTSTQRKESLPSTSGDQSATTSFAPYTLPSLKTLEPEEEEEVTQPFCPDKPQEDLLGEEEDMEVIKEKTKPRPNSGNDLKFDEWWKGNKEEEGLVRKRPRSEETSPQDTKKSKTDENNLIKNASCDNTQRSSNKRKATDDDDDGIFTLPPQARQRERTTENVTDKQTIDTELFALPTSTARTRRQPIQQDASLILPTQDIPVSLPTSESSVNVPISKEDITSSKFIGKEENMTFKESGSTGEVNVSRTVVMVEPMVKVPLTKLQPQSASSHDSSHLHNFKMFKKVNAICILKIIGGSDFVENHQVEPSQKFKTNMQPKRDDEPLEEREPSFDYELFDLDAPIQKRR